MAYNYVVQNYIKNIATNSHKDIETYSDVNLNNSFNFKNIFRFIIENYKKILLFILVFVIIYVVEHITYYNTILYGLTTPPGLQPQQTNQIKSNTLKKKTKQSKK
jgi:hypothetical protein